ncbi:MAG: translation initiation factor IF-2 [Clostridiales bacterium]|nr:translation initiation factor IF-2 [Clostridiales bacterium]
MAIKEENNKIENIKKLESVLQSKSIKESIKQLEDAKNLLESFYGKISEKFNSIKIKKLEEEREREKEAKQEAIKQANPIKIVNSENNTNNNRFANKNNTFQNRQNKPFNNNGAFARSNSFKNERSFGDKPFNKGEKPSFVNKSANFKAGTKPGVKSIKPSFVEPIINIKEKERVFKNKKKPVEQTQEKKALSKKAQFKMSLVNDDLNETVKYRRVKTKKDVKETEHIITTIEKAIMDTENITVKDLSEKIGKPVAEIVKKLFVLGIMSTINSSIDFDTAELVSNELGVTLEYKKPETFEEKLSKIIENSDEEEKLTKRAPVVTVMGHVDHGKTSLLDAIRKTNVISGEAGGITQHIGAYTVKANGQMITFIDTPGHAAFTAMRERGANITDVAILVVAADDGIMPQTLEAIKHIKNAGVPMIVAINKIDKPTANIDKVKQQLADHDVLSDEWGGDTIMVPISAKGNQNIDKLLEMVILQADVLDLKANPERKAMGTVIEAKIDKGKGPVATILVQNGTLKVGDTIITGLAVGRIRAMFDENGKSVKSAGPSVPVSVLGLSEVPQAGDTLHAVDEKLSKQILEERKTKLQRERVSNASGVSAEDLFHKAEDNMKKQLNVIIKADVQGSCEALTDSINEITSDEVKINVISHTVGHVNETDVTLASTANAIIVCFNTKADNKAKDLIDRNKVEVYYSRVLYDVIDFLTERMKSMFEPKYKEVYTGKAEVRMVYKITGVGFVAGSYVLDGKISRNCKTYVIRNGETIGSYNLESLKIRKDDVKEVGYGFECGIRLAKFEELQAGDIIEAYNLEKIVF